MTAPTPSPEEFAEDLYRRFLPDECNAFVNVLASAVAARDAALLAPLRAEVERLRESNRKLNERATKAEGAVKITVEDCRRQGVSLGRALANAGYAALEAENARLRAALQPFAEIGAQLGIEESHELAYREDDEEVLTGFHDGEALRRLFVDSDGIARGEFLFVNDFRAAARALAEGKT